ncbi:MAG: allophanate hydrolase, partial [Verrucomicrobiales bacterium]
MNIPALLESYRNGSTTPKEVCLDLLEKARAADSAIWITLLDEAALEPYFENLGSTDLPLYGVPFAIKDNIDLAGVPTTAACPEFEYTPEKSATVVQRLIDAGAIPIGKTNLDQFATGLVGVRSPYGFPTNAFHPDYIPGGSSSGSAIAVARDLVAFSLGTDTAGSGRVPAAFNNLVGLKPTRGLLSTSGVVPACRTLDSVSIFTNSAADAATVLKVAAAHDPDDAYSRPAASDVADYLPDAFTFGVPEEDQLEFFGDEISAGLFAQSRERLKAMGGSEKRINFAPFLEAARLLYEGPWVAERYVATRDMIDNHPEALHPITRKIIAGGTTPKAHEGFSAAYKLQACKKLADAQIEGLDFILTPTTGTIYTSAEVEA